MPDADGQLAFVHEANDFGGSERVLEALLARWPAAPILAGHFGEYEECWPPRWRSRTEWVRCGDRKRHFLAPIYARRFARAPTRRARVVVTLTHGGWGLATRLAPETRMVCYSAGPPRWLFTDVTAYLRRESPLLRPLLRSAMPALRAHHRALIPRSARVLTNSRASAEALSTFYGRPVEVLYPPVRTEFFTPAPVERGHFLVVSRLVPQKRLEAAVDAFRELDETLVVVGHGPWLEHLRARAPRNVRFAGWVNDAELREYYRASRGLICPSVEEFGIVMAEAHACGVPVIAPRAGGALEIVDDPATGVLVEQVNRRTIAAAVRDVASRAFDPRACRLSAERFSTRRFVERMEAVVAEEMMSTDAAPARSRHVAAAAAS